MNGRDTFAVVTKYASDDRHYNVFNYIFPKCNGVWLVFQELGPVLNLQTCVDRRSCQALSWLPSH